MKKKRPVCKGRNQHFICHKMGKGGHVTTEALVKICTALGCTLDDIMEIVPEKCGDE